HAGMGKQRTEGTKACGKALVPQRASQKAVFRVEGIRYRAPRNTEVQDGRARLPGLHGDLV
ncbi:MAG: hypothetical protein MUQ10_11950, partial [Anaerolineae bacterium]|nr:hypothetical protein [Anaerolineae bacterium]